jgi:hypothetical protein
VIATRCNISVGGRKKITAAAKPLWQSDPKTVKDQVADLASWAAGAALASEAEKLAGQLLVYGWVASNEAGRLAPVLIWRQSAQFARWAEAQLPALDEVVLIEQPDFKGW